MQKAFKDIVERLEELQAEAAEKKVYYRDYPAIYDVSDMWARTHEDMQHAIGIVNQVAQTYEQEVCEWVEKSVDSIKLVREPHRLRLFHIEEDRQYCPYCGKKIKVAE